jgi:hypothetical protein
MKIGYGLYYSICAFGGLLIGILCGRFEVPLLPVLLIIVSICGVVGAKYVGK